MMVKSVGGALSEYWVLPGNKKSGYCREKV
jgi:hypothetical protein